MEFCPKCGSLLIPKKDKKTGEVLLVCPSCGYTTKATEDVSERYQIKEKIEHRPTDLPVVITEEALTNAPTERVTCPKCGYNEAYVLEVPTIDEEQDSVVVVYRCKKCGYSWRET
ncbi:MAG: transcription factor S [Candidatus Asgardarchaeia archaeon]